MLEVNVIFSKFLIHKHVVILVSLKFGRLLTSANGIQQHITWSSNTRADGKLDPWCS